MKEFLMEFGKHYLAKYYCKIISLHSLKKRRVLYVPRESSYCLLNKLAEPFLLSLSSRCLQNTRPYLRTAQTSCSQFQCYLSTNICVSTFQCDALLIAGKHCKPVDIWLLKRWNGLATRTGLCSQENTSFC